ncbi:MAG: antirepressor regulating drug resistance protein [Planctomycetota bacterium]|nr:MAG: antirepressor regulating drug resistance protein [Planctomycetota bacterium]
MLVLLKFVTPPLFHLPVTIETPVASELRSVDVGHVSNVPVPRSDPSPLKNTVAVNDAAPPVKSSVSDLPSVAITESRRVDRESRSFLASTLKTCATFWARRPDLRSTLLMCWMFGTALWMTLQIVRVIRFQRRVLRGATPDAEMQQQTQRLADAMMLRSVPRVLIVDAAVSPMLWGCGSRAKLVFPSDLAARLDDDARALFWWHPVVWWAKQQIEESEEECCDAWVVHQFPNTPRQYAEALLDTIDYLCESRQALPPVACGLGQAHFLRHRLTKIMRGAAPKALSQRVRFVIALVAALLLPLQPFVFGSASAISSRIDAVPVVEAVSQRSEVRGQTAEADPLEVPPTAISHAEIVSPSSVPSRLRGEKTWSTAASADGRFVARATTARRVVLTDRVTNLETDLSSHGITSIAFVPGQKSFVSAGSDGRVTLWDSETAEPRQVLHAHDDALRTVSVSPRGDVAAVGGKDGSVLLLDLSTGTTLTELPRQAMSVNSVRFSPDARNLAVAVGDWDSHTRGQVVLFDVESGTPGAVLDCESAPGAIAFASNGDLIVGLWNGQADLWNLESRRLVGSAQANKSVVAAASFSPDNPALREVDFVATRSVATEGKPDRSLWETLFDGFRP